MSALVFISYSHLNAASVARLRHYLIEHGATIWIDHESLPPGTPDWQRAIRAGLDAADVVLYAASPEAVDSVYVQAELNIAHDLKKRIMPFWLEGETWSRAAPFFLTNAQHIDARGERFEAGLQKLLHALTGSLGTPESPPSSVLIPFGSALAPTKSMPAYPPTSQLSQESDPLTDATLLGVSLYAHRRYDESLSAFERALVLDPKSAHLWSSKGHALENLERYQDALAALEQALALNPTNTAAWNGKGWALDHLRRYDESLDAYERALVPYATFATHESAWNGKGWAFYHVGKFSSALVAFERVLTLSPEYDNAWNGKGWALYHLGRYKEALTAFDEALALVPKSANVWNGKAWTLNFLRRYQKAVAAFDQTLTLQPKFAEAWIGKGAAFRELKFYDLALAAFDQAIAIDPNFTLAWNEKIDLLNKLRRTLEAEEAMSQWGRV